MCLRHGPCGYVSVGKMGSYARCSSRAASPRLLRRPTGLAIVPRSYDRQ